MEDSAPGKSINVPVSHCGSDEQTGLQPWLPSQPLPNAPGDSSRYVGSTHWSGILDDIHGLRAALSQHDNASRIFEPAGASSDSVSGRNLIIFGSPSNFSIEAIILQYLPSKMEVDRLSAFYSEGKTFIIPFIHVFQFRHQYRSFWADPLLVSSPWLFMLFSICSVTSMVRGTIEIASMTRKNVIAEAIHFRSGWPTRWAIMETQILLAIFLYSKASCDCDDSLGTLQAGLFHGGNICLENCHTRSPRNLANSNFDENTHIIPAPHSENEVTGLLWFIVKDRQMASFGKVCRDTLSFSDKSEPEILQPDNEIRRMQTTILSSLRARPLSNSTSYTPPMVMT
ncbi:hypothetical protein N7532_003412 [Penicillium argentinense]|uniref:Transcription factor domain-containing protein n=1 Tax=Penicillium argentinense TaxID=1131581 RepID=A0A9W9KEM4_9EURO|nr:uncharacterized protein N7532_003412 [Penicillium argentinense]KAJ5102883.1 hypothetical protein N7532_003412 [Penicillium argentinense]